MNHHSGENRKRVSSQVQFLMNSDSAELPIIGEQGGALGITSMGKSINLSMVHSARSSMREDLSCGDGT